MNEIPSFDEAVSRFRDFIDRHGITGEILWIFREDVSTDKNGGLRVRLPLPADNLERVIEHYQAALRGGLGVHLSVFCLLEGRPCCYVWVPKAPAEADQALLAGLKLSVPKTPRTARSLVGDIFTRLLDWRRRSPHRDPWVEDLPSRALRD